MEKAKKIINGLRQSLSKNNFLDLLVLMIMFFCIFSIFKKLDDAFTIISNSLAIFLAVWYFVRFEKKEITNIIQTLLKWLSLNKVKSYSKPKNTLPTLSLCKQYFLTEISHFFITLKRYFSVTLIFLYKERWRIISYLFLLILLLVASNKLFNFIWIKKYQALIIVLAVASGGLTFWHNRRMVEEEIKEEKNNEELAEHTRASEFYEKYPRINKIPVLRNLVKWMYKEGWSYGIALILILAGSFIIMNSNLGLLPLQNDEFLTYSAASYITEGNLKTRDLFYGADNNKSPDFYSRGIPYSISVALTSIILGGVNSEYNLRFISVIFTLIFLLTIYLFCKKNTSKSLALIITYFISIFYLVIYHGRISRFYSLLLLLFTLLTYIYLNLYKKVCDGLNTNDYQKSITIIIKKNISLLTIFIILFIIGLKTHYNIAFLIPPLLIFSLVHFKKKPLRGVSLVGLFLIFIGIIVNQYIYNFFPLWYFNLTGDINYNFIKQLFSFLISGPYSLIFFIIPLIIYKKLPTNIKLSYFMFIIVFPLFLFFVNGKQFHDPRYFIFLFPFYIFIIIFCLYYIIRIFTKNKTKYIIVPLTILLSVLFVNKLQLPNYCVNNILFSCPISDKSMVFNLDRWNYDFNKIYSIIGENIKENTLVISRSLYNFYDTKYGIPKDIQYSLIGSLENKKYSLKEVQNKNIIFIVYPNLYYNIYDISNYDDIYNYLIAQTNKPIYVSPEKKVLIYKLQK